VALECGRDHPHAIIFEEAHLSSNPSPKNNQKKFNGYRVSLE